MAYEHDWYQTYLSWTTKPGLQPHHVICLPSSRSHRKVIILIDRCGFTCWWNIFQKFLTQKIFQNQFLNFLLITNFLSYSQSR